MNPVEIRGLVKRFGRFTAVDDLDLEVRSGTVHGFLGPNGAGKSTTIRALLGLYRRDGGSVTVLGRDPAVDAPAVTRRVSYVPGDVALWPNLTGSEVLDALGGLRRARDRAAESALIERFALDPGRRVRTYSKGNRQKLALVAAFAAPTDLLVLDEPTSGLDPLMERVFGECVAEATASGRSVLLSSHILGEVERLCSDVTIIKDGRSVESGPLVRLRHLSATTVTAQTDGPPPAGLRSGLEALGLEPDVDGGRCSCAVPRERVPDVLGLLSGLRLTDVTCTPASLEDLFLRYYAAAAR
ncbi:ABC transporter ATP-binding protein [Tsukamurella sp. 8F]|uniref:ABC transporter ATP-binding protein n=1 Tax=unclassified Tsukamurella TaxID=2633480 RepID=UPI0023B8A1F8|nr:MULTISPECIES: ABC transporter ATP-binding protein [unclassified Tsukamurella]MDF0532591.1 ABC transporter ATP-binding protein [Tsukamurella sp. 8J]MDF0589338.1 ABC transporter ATP-binding protein [Tsukamurella sp. 8F]